MDLFESIRTVSHAVRPLMFKHHRILREDNRDFNKAYDYVLKWNTACVEVRHVFEGDLEKINPMY